MKDKGLKAIPQLSILKVGGRLKTIECQAGNQITGLNQFCKIGGENSPEKSDSSLSG
jgi:hypothetical protein